MNCQKFDFPLGDYVDGRLAGADAQALQAHVATCARCAALAADLRAIRTAAQSLPSHEPGPHVWTALAAAVEAERQPTGRAGWASWRQVWQPLATAAMAVIVTGTLTFVGMRLEPLKQAAGTGPAVVADAADNATPAELVRSAEVEYIQAITGLEQITSAAGDALDAETADAMKANLTVIDTAIGESRAALKEEPESELAISSLFSALRSKLALLQDMAALINEMRQGNAEGAARIASGLNQ